MGTGARGASGTSRTATGLAPPNTDAARPSDGASDGASPVRGFSCSLGRSPAAGGPAVSRRAQRSASTSSRRPNESERLKPAESPGGGGGALRLLAPQFRSSSARLGPGGGPASPPRRSAAGPLGTKRLLAPQSRSSSARLGPSGSRPPSSRSPKPPRRGSRSPYSRAPVHQSTRASAPVPGLGKSTLRRRAVENTGWGLFAPGFPQRANIHSADTSAAGADSVQESRTVC